MIFFRSDYSLGGHPKIMEALMALGFTQPEAKHALCGLDLETLSVEQAITEALKGFSQ